MCEHCYDNEFNSTLKVIKGELTSILKVYDSGKHGRYPAGTIVNGKNVGGKFKPKEDGVSGEHSENVSSMEHRGVIDPLTGQPPPDAEKGKNTLCIYHNNCVDGMGSAWAVHKALGSGVHFHPGDYTKEPPDVTGKHVLLVDFSYPKHVVADMAKKAKSITILDHHDSAIKELTPDMPAMVNNKMDASKSGALLVWNHFFPNKPPPPMMQHIDDRDRWVNKLDNTDHVSRVLYPNMPKNEDGKIDFTKWEHMMSPEGYDNVVAEGKKLSEQFHKELNEHASKPPEWWVVDGKVIPAHTAPAKFTSDLSNRTSKGQHFSAVYQEYPNGVKIRFGSQSDAPPVNGIAKSLGGGGHPHAASTFMTPEQYKAFKEGMKGELAARAEDIAKKNKEWEEAHAANAVKKSNTLFLKALVEKIEGFTLGVAKGDNSIIFANGDTYLTIEKAISELEDDLKSEVLVQKFWSEAARAAAALARHFSKFRTTAAEQKFGKFKNNAESQSLHAHNVSVQVAKKWGNGFSNPVNGKDLIKAAIDHGHAIEHHKEAISQHSFNPTLASEKARAYHHERIDKHTKARDHFLARAKSEGINFPSDNLINAHVKAIAEATEAHKKSGFAIATRHALTNAYMNAAKAGISRDYLHAAMHSSVRKLEKENVELSYV